MLILTGLNKWSISECKLYSTCWWSDQCFCVFMLFLKWRAEILRYICIPDILVGCLVMILWIFHNVPPRVRSAVHYLWHCVLHCDVVVQYFVVNKCGWLYADVLLSFIVCFFFFLVILYIKVSLFNMIYCISYHQRTNKYKQMNKVDVCQL